MINFEKDGLFYFCKKCATVDSAKAKIIGFDNETLTSTCELFCINCDNKEIINIR